jgi:hypothetical protein
MSEFADATSCAGGRARAPPSEIDARFVDSGYAISDHSGRK